MVEQPKLTNRDVGKEVVYIPANDRGILTEVSSNYARFKVFGSQWTSITKLDTLRLATPEEIADRQKTRPEANSTSDCNSAG